MTAIIRSLGPVEYLPEHGGKRPSIDLDVRFAFDSAALPPEAARQLDQLAAALVSERLEAGRFRIAGHTDSRGTASYNQALSERRAASVKRYLIERHGIDASRLDTVGWGEEKLKNPLDPRTAKNRRVEIVSLEPPPTATLPDHEIAAAAGEGKQIKIDW